MKLRHLAATTGLLMLAAVLSAPTSAQAATDGAYMVQQKVSVVWAGAKAKGAKVGTFTVPGIGNGKITCQNDKTMIELTPFNRRAETQMWSEKHETKNGVRQVAVKEARVYTAAHALDASGSGTGPTTNEGFNQQNGRWVEDSSRGYINGLISQRPGRNQAAGGKTTPPSTAFYLTWRWSGFGQGGLPPSCEVYATFTTRVNGYKAEQQRTFKAAKSKVVKIGKKKVRVGTTAKTIRRPAPKLALNWHGDGDAQGRDYATAHIPGYGNILVACPTSDTGVRKPAYLFVDPINPASTLRLDTIESEGELPYHVSGTSAGTVNGRMGPLPLPEYGMARLYLHDGKRQVVKALITIKSSTNHNVPSDPLPDVPVDNFCEVAVGFI